MSNEQQRQAAILACLVTRAEDALRNLAEAVREMGR